MAHHARADAAHALQEKAQAVYLSMDNGTLGCEANHRSVWTWLSEHSAEATYLVVLEDDALPIPAFTEQLDAALTASPFPVVGLYLGTGYPEHLQPRIQQAVARAEKQDASWITTNEHLHGVGIAIKTDLVADMLNTRIDRPFDYHIRNWAKANNHTVGFCFPSLLDHADEPSLVNHPDGGERTEPRKAWNWGSRQSWTSNSVQL